MATTRHFHVTLKRSAHHWPEDQRKTLESLGLTRFGKDIFLKDTPAVRGMLYKVVHAVTVTPKDGAPPPSIRQRVKAAKQKGGKAKQAKQAKTQANA
jgi:large subunit ribosomal protein L30